MKEKVNRLETYLMLKTYGGILIYKNLFKSIVISVFFKENRLIKLIVALLIIIPIIVIFTYINFFGINVPFWDEWSIVPLLDKFYSSHLSFIDLFQQHNEHRLLFPQMLIIAIASLTQFNLKDEMWVSFMVSIISFSLIAYIYFNKNRGNLASLILFVPISYLFFGLFQFENILWGYQIQIYLCVLGIIGSLFFIQRSKNIDINFVVAILFSVFATFSFFNGLLVWPIIFIYLLINKKYKLSTIWVFFSVVSYTVFFYGWIHPVYHPSVLYSLNYPLIAIQYLTANIGAPFSYDVNSSIFFGCIIVLFYISSFILIIKNNSIKENSFWLSLIVFSLGSSVLCMIGRSGFGVLQALSSRYTTFTILGVIGVYSIVVNGYLKPGDNHRAYKTILAVLLGLIIIGLIIGNDYGLNEGKNTANSRQYEINLLNNYDNLTNSQIVTIFPDPSSLNNYITIMKKYNLKYGT